MKTKDLFTHRPEFQSSSLAFCLDVPYQKLVDVFGRPNSVGDKYKVDAKWTFQTNCGIYFTIYNYKTGRNYCGKDGDKIKDITDWHIGMSAHSKADKLAEMFTFINLIK